MHETVAKTRKLVLEEEPREDFGDLFSQRLQEEGLSRALSGPLSSHLQLLYQEVFRWLRLAHELTRLSEGASPASQFGELLFSSRQLRTALENLLPFMERAEDNLSEKEEITHRESGYEREVAPFSRLDSTAAFRDFLASRPEFSTALAGEGAQLEADLLKVAFMELRLREGIQKPGDVYALVAEMLLDGRRHLVPAFEEDADFLQAVKKASQGD